MKLPRNIDGDDLARRFKLYGYHPDHQTLSHQRLTAVILGILHSRTIPFHKPLRIGTLHEILKEVAKHQEKRYEIILAELFG